MLGNLLKLSGYALMGREVADFFLNSPHYRAKEQNREQFVCSITASLVGMAVGVGVGLLFAPRAGKETREIISDTTYNQIERLKSEIAERKKLISEMISSKKDEFCSAAPEKAEDAAVEA